MEVTSNRCNQSGSIYRRIVVYSSAAAIAILIGITSILYFPMTGTLAPVIAQSEQSQQSPLSQNPETPKSHLGASKPVCSSTL